MSLTLIQTVQAAESFRINIDDQVKSRVAINDTLGVFVQKSFSAGRWLGHLYVSRFGWGAMDHGWR